jgi:hypothetical protein
MICSSSSDNSNNDFDETDYQVKQCEFCACVKSTVILLVKYDYDSNQRKDLVEKLFLCDRCNAYLNPTNTFETKEIPKQ